MRPAKRKPPYIPLVENEPQPAPAPASPTIQALKRRRDELYAEAQGNPDSDAGEILRALLLSGILSTDAEALDDAPRLAMGEERRRHQLESRRLSDEAKAQTKHAMAQADVLERKLRDQNAKLERVAKAAADAAAGKFIDHRAVYERIAEIVGLRAPSQPRIEPQGDTGRPRPGDQESD